MKKHAAAKKGEVTEQLREIYKNAYSEGIWLYEIGPTHRGGHYMAAAGSVKDIEDLERKLGVEIDISKLTLGDIVDISLPGTGESREEACLDAIKEYKRYLAGKDSTK